jgi:hypothetical protein
MITALYSFGKNRGLGFDPYFPLKPHYYLRLSPSGSVRIEPIKEPEIRLPEKSGRSSNIEANFLYDTAMYALAFNAIRKERLLTQFLTFWGKTLEHLTNCGDVEALKAVKAFCDQLALSEICSAVSQWEKSSKKRLVSLKGPNRISGLAEIRKDLSEVALETFERLASGKPPAPIQKAIGDLAIEGEQWVILTLEDDNTPLALRPKPSELWVQLQKPTDDKPTSTCLLTGKPCKPVRLHRALKGVPGGDKGIPLISFEQEVTRYKGRKKEDNFPISREAHDTYVAAFRHIVDQGNVFVSINSCLLVWVDEAEHDELLTPILTVLRSKEKEEVKAAWDEVERLDSDVTVHLAMLRSSKGRISILGYHTLSVNQLRANLLRFHEEFSEFPEYTPRGLFSWMLKKNIKGKDKETAKLYTMVTLAVVLGTPYPLQIFPSLIQWIKNTDSALDLFLHLTWLRAYVCRDYGINPPPIKNPFQKEPLVCEPRIEENVNLNETDIGYNLGRLVALDCHLRRMTGISVSEISEVRSATNNPHMYISRSYRMLPTLEKLEKKGWGKPLREMREEVKARLAPLVATPIRLTLLEESSFQMAFTYQKTYLRRYNAWRKQQYKAAKAAEEEN